MELIPPENQQNLNPNPVNPDTAPETSNQPENQPQTQQSKLYKIFDFVRASIFELFLLALFSILILTTFNYFNLIPLSSVFPTLSFLPQQQNTQNAILNTISQDDITYFSNNFPNLSSCNSSVGKNIVLGSLVKCNYPETFTSSKKQVQYLLVPSTDQSSYVGTNGVQINYALKIDTNGKDDMGLLFGDDATGNRFYIGYYPTRKSWGIQFLFGSTISDFTPLYSPPENSASHRAFFSVMVSGDGKTIGIIFPDGTIHAYNENLSFYTKAGSLPIVAILPPSSTLTIYSLNYYTPQ